MFPLWFRHRHLKIDTFVQSIDVNRHAGIVNVQRLQSDLTGLIDFGFGLFGLKDFSSWETMFEFELLGDEFCQGFQEGVTVDGVEGFFGPIQFPNVSGGCFGEDGGRHGAGAAVDDQCAGVCGSSSGSIASIIFFVRDFSFFFFVTFIRQTDSRRFGNDTSVERLVLQQHFGPFVVDSTIRHAHYDMQIFGMRRIGRQIHDAFEKGGLSFDRIFYFSVQFNLSRTMSIPIRYDDGMLQGFVVHANTGIETSQIDANGNGTIITTSGTTDRRGLAR
mmetsp:Transcript_112746/g.168716  ORF Transcript_112746/g.168716 Transcript_112746/m.168716 type:complete len:275 (-) Transcript_112746:215-1039(-)